jgi:RNA polymerase sigma factor (sigma-70 family)
METMLTQEDRVWERCLAGDGDAFGLMFDLHQDRVFIHAIRLLRHRQDAEDAIAVAFLELWRKRAAVRVVNGSVLPWLLVTVSHTSRNLRRSRHRYAKLLDVIPHGQTQPSAEETALDSLTDPKLSDALARLSPTDLRLMTLVLLEGYSATDIAPLLGLSPGAARTRLHRLRESLRKHLGAPTLTGYLQMEGELR